MKSLLIALAISCMAKPLLASATLVPQIEKHDFQRNKNKDRPRLKTYHRPVKVFAPIKLGRENIWTAFALGLVLGGYAGQFFFSKRGDSQSMGVVLGVVLLMELIIVLCHPIIWLIRWIRLLHWQLAWKKRYRACPGQY